MKVYKSFQFFRLEGSIKQRSNRLKYLIGKSSISQKFLDGFITNVSNYSQSILSNILTKTILLYCKYESQTYNIRTKK